MREVPRVRTALALALAAHELVSALRSHGESPNADEARLLLAQVWLETGRGGACDNFNAGNITASEQSYQGEAFRPAWFTVSDASPENLKHLHSEMLVGRAPRAFRSYPDAGAGFADYVAQLVHTFPSIIKAARTGDAFAVAAAIRDSHYTPGINIPAVGKSLNSLADEFKQGGLFSELPKAGAAPPTPPASPCSV